jgi:hypothetical protein
MKKTKKCAYCGRRINKLNSNSQKYHKKCLRLYKNSLEAKKKNNDRGCMQNKIRYYLWKQLSDKEQLELINKFSKELLNGE